MARRETSTVQGTFLLSPGPGTYRAPSEFGYYEAKIKYDTKSLDKQARSQLATANGIRNKRNLLVKGVLVDGMSTATTLMSRSNSQPNVSLKQINAKSQAKK